MADIDLERRERSGLGWLWALLALLLLGLLAWWVWPDDDPDMLTPVDDPAAVDTLAPADTAAMGDTIGADLGAIVANPSEWIGRSFPDTRADVGPELTDRGFFIESGGAELMVIIIDQPREQPKDINPGQTVRITGGTLRGPDHIGQIEGDLLEDDTEELLREQEIFLVVDEEDIEILEGGDPQEGTDPARGVEADTMG